MRAVLASGVEFDGVVAFNDSLALGAMRVVQEAGLRVPGDVAFIGFDDLDEARYSLPTLSSIDPGRADIAEVAVAWLVERIASARGSIEPREHETAVRLVQRESSG
jgi:DNA-binding LacI/PurR family transcriptional regulator